MTKEYAYITQDGEEIIVTEFAKFVCIGQGHGMTVAKSMDEAEKILAAKGYTRKGFKDEQGVTRHALSRGKIEFLYTQLENFIADCTVEEYNEYKESFTAVKTLIHQRIRETLKK